MPTVYYLNWDQAVEDAEDRPIESHFFSALHGVDGEEIETVPEDWYRNLTDVPVMDVEDIYTAFQGGVPITPEDTQSPEDFRAARQSHRDAKDRSMSVGDIIDIDGRLFLVASFGFTEVEWGDAPDLDGLFPTP